MKKLSYLFRSRSLTIPLKQEYAAVNFEIVSDDFFDELEMLNINDDDNDVNNDSTDDVIGAVVGGSPQFKMPNLKDFETKTKTTPKATRPTLSQSPVLVSRLKKKKIIAISSSDEDEEEEEAISVKEPPKKVVKLKRINKFIDDEAELSGLASDDEDLVNEDLDAFEESFVDDATQKEELTHLDQKAIYLQSIR